MRPICLNLSVAISSMAFCLPVSATEIWNFNNHEIGTKGYLRAGGGVSESHTQVCFKAPGAGAKYRLGNECEVFGKTSAYYEYKSSDDTNASFFRYEYMPEFEGRYGSKIELNDHAQNFIEFGNIADTPIKLWIGRRQYFRRDVHINDFFYMNLKGDGLGIRDIPLGFAHFDYTYLQDSRRPVGIVYPNRIDLHNHEFSLSDIETNDDGKLTVDFRWAEIDGDTTSKSSTRIYSADGWTVSFQHRQKDFLGGTNTAVLQYGRGAARSAWSSPFVSKAALGKLTSKENANALEDADTWRLLDYHLYETEQWAMMSTIIWEKRDSADFDGKDQTWTSIGARPSYFLNQHWRVTGEFGLDHIDYHSTGQDDGHLIKLTAALEWAPERRFFSRPAFRFYITQAAWSDSFRGQVGGPVYADEDHGWNAGVQIEHWW